MGIHYRRCITQFETFRTDDERVALWTVLPLPMRFCFFALYTKINHVTKDTPDSKFYQV